MHPKTKTCRGCGREFAAGETFCPDDGSRLSSSSQAHDLAGVDPLIGMTLDGRYRLLRAIGEGGMGVVYEAEHVLIEKRVAIKVLRESFTRRPDVVERFRQEAKSASKIGHPNIVDVSDFGETPNRSSFIVMEMLIGEDLADVLSRECALSPARAATIVFQIAIALAAAHRKGIIHRDLKPENIYLIERDGQPDFVKIVDFGVAKMSDIETLGGRKLTRTGMIFGTPEYMSPEHAGGKSLDHRVDIYALGVMLYELLTGRVPFEGDNFMDVLSKHGRDPVPELRAVNPGARVSSELARVVFRALEKEPERRYQSMEELSADLRLAPELRNAAGIDARVSAEWARSITPPAHAESVPTSTSPVETHARTRSARQPLSPSRLFVVRATALVALGVVVVLAWALSTSRRAPVPSAATAGVRSSGVLVAAPAAGSAVVDPSTVASHVQPTAADEVEVLIRTEPSGARVTVEGTDLTCAATPCSLQAPRGRALVLRAQAGARSAARTLTFQDATEIHLTLAAPARRRAPAMGTKSVAKPSSDLKVPAAFR